MINSALILEGGALRGVYVSGVLDVFMEYDIEFKYVLGISAGAVNAVNYVSKQIGRTAKINIDYVNDPEYMGLHHIIKSGGIFNFDFLFGKGAEKVMPYDEDAFACSRQRCIIGATDCLTGKQVFFERNAYKDLIAPLKASCTLPLLSRLVYVDGIPYTDGGVSNGIPFEKAKKEGYDKIVLILTKPEGYRKQASRLLNPIFRVYYRKYPLLVKALCTMTTRYEKRLQRINELERNGKIFVIRPTTNLKVHRAERNQDKLRLLYLEGKEDARKMLPQMLDYLAK